MTEELLHHEDRGRSLLRRGLTAAFSGDVGSSAGWLLGLMDPDVTLLSAVTRQVQQTTSAIGGWVPGLQELRVGHEVRGTISHLLVTARTGEAEDRIAVRVLSDPDLRDADRVAALRAVHRDAVARHGSDLFYVLLLAGDVSDRHVAERVAGVHRQFADLERTLVVEPRSTAAFLALTRSQLEVSAAGVAEADVVGSPR